MHLARAVPLSLWPEATRLHYLRRRDGLQRALERLENLREWMVVKLDQLDGDPDLEPSLGMTEHNSHLRGVPARYFDQLEGSTDDREADGDRFYPNDSDFEPSLGSGGGTAAGGPRQMHWARRSYSLIVDGEAEHDGREPDEDREPGEDLEPDTHGFPVPIYASDHDQTRFLGEPYGLLVGVR